MDFTGERFVPTNELLTDEIGIEHLHRYHTIIDFVKDKEVLDIACGEGYGSAILALNAKTVYGVDIDSSSIEYATQTYSSTAANLRFLTGSVAKIPLPDNSIDVIVSFETIEHVDEKTQHAFLQDVKRVLRVGGSFIISTPDKENYSDRYNYKNEFHVKEFTSQEFLHFLNGYFKNTATFYQGFEIVSAITPPNLQGQISINVRDWEFSPLSSSKKYLIALCSDSELEGKSILPSVVFNTAKNYLEVIDRLLEKEAHILELGTWGKSLDLELGVKGKFIFAQQKELLAKDARIEFFTSEIQKKDSELEQKAVICSKQTEKIGILKEQNHLQQVKLDTLQKSIERLQQTLEASTERNNALQGEVEEARELIQGL